MAAWARILALIFIISFTVSALVSLFLLDEFEDVTHSTRLPAPLLRHSLLPAGNSRRLGAANRRGPRSVEEDVKLPSRRPDRLPGSEVHDNIVATDSVPSAEHEHKDMESMLEEDLSTFHEWSELNEHDMDESYDDSDRPSDEPLPSLLFGGSASSLDSISLWTLLWKGLGLNLTEWDVDISQLNYTFAAPSEQSQKRIAYQQMFRAHAAGTSTGGAGGASSASEAEDAATAALAAAGMGKPISAAGLEQQRPKVVTPSISVLHDLKAQQGIAPFVSLSSDCQQIKLALVHAFYSRGEGDQAKDARGDGLIEWFTRPASPLLYPLYSHPTPHSHLLNPFEGETISLTSWAFTPDVLLANFPETPRGTRRKLVEGDWVLSEWVRLPGVIHAQSVTNSAGSGGKTAEQDVVAVAYEEIDLESAQGMGQTADKAETKIHLFFQPLDAAPSAVEAAAETSAPASTSTLPSRQSLVIPLQTLRLVTALSVVASSVSAPDAKSRVEIQVLYALRGDRRVFRMIEIVVEKRNEASNEWNWTYQHGKPGPVAKRKGFISQTVALQGYSGDLDLEANDGATPLSGSSLEPMKVIASELNWAHGPVVLAGPLAAGTINKWQVPGTSASVNGRTHRHHHSHRKQHQMQPYLQPMPPFSAAIYHTVDEEPSDPRPSSWIRESWISSTKTVGKYGDDVFPLSIHRGNEGTLSSLVTAASSNRRFVAFAQVPLITTVDGNSNFEPIEIVHLEQDTVFTGLAFNDAGTILAVADNHQDIIVLHRSLQAANQYRKENAGTAEEGKKETNSPTPEAATASDPSAQQNAPTEGSVPPATPSADASPSSHSDSPAADAAGSSSSSDATPSSAPHAAPARKRHAWEVMTEVILPDRVKQLTLLSVQIVDIPIPPETLHPPSPPVWPRHLMEQDTKEAQTMEAKGDVEAKEIETEKKPEENADPSTVVVEEQTTPFLVFLFQGGVIGTMQLKAIGTPSPPQSPAATIAAHFHHQPLPATLSWTALESFLGVHWDLLLGLICGTVWMIFSLPRFNRALVVAQQVQQQPPAAAAAAAQAPGFFRRLILGAGAVQLNQLHNNMAPPGAAPAAVPAAPVEPPMSALNPLAALQPRPAPPAQSNGATSSSSSSSSVVSPTSSSSRGAGAESSSANEPSAPTSHAAAEGQ